MPEGHTIHRVARDHRKAFVGQELRASSPQGRFSDEAKQLDKRRLIGVDAVGKHLFYQWEPRGRRRGEVLHIHLGLYGKFRLHRLRASRTGQRKPLQDPRGAVRLRVVGDEAAFDLNGPNRCELMDAKAYAERIARLGPDPLRDDADPDRAWARIHRSRASIGSLLMNQEVIAGVGNIYRSEVLHLVGVHPSRPGKEMDRQEFDLIWDELVRLMSIGVKHNRIIIREPHEVGKPRSRMNRDERLRIYKKASCIICGTRIDQFEIGGRQAFACSDCQV